MMQDESFVVDLYIRVSTDRQVNEGDSLEEQENELKKYCEYRGFDIYHTLIEKGRSGGNTNRPEYQELINDVRQKRINAVVVKKLDRLSRSLLDFEQLMILLNENNVEFISLKESFDTTSAMGKAMLRVALVFAQLEREQTSERIIDVMDYRATKGIYNGGNRPYGYACVNKELVPYPKEKEIIETIFQSFITFKSTVEVEQVLNSKGYKRRTNIPWDRRNIDKILKNPVYIGKLRWRGQCYDGLHLPIISEDMFNQVQNIFQSRGYMRKGQKINAMLADVLFCKCKMAMKPCYTRKSSGKLYFYYRCSSGVNSHRKTPCRNDYLIMEDVDHRVINRIKEFATDSYLACIQKRIDRHNAIISQFIQETASSIKAIENDLADIQAKKQTYFDSLVMKEFTGKERAMINDKIEEFTQTEKEYKAKINALKFERRERERKTLSIDELKKELLYFSINANAISDKERKDWIYNQVSRITYYSHEHIDINFKLLDGQINKLDDKE